MTRSILTPGRRRRYPTGKLLRDQANRLYRVVGGPELHADDEAYQTVEAVPTAEQPAAWLAIERLLAIMDTIRRQGIQSRPADLGVRVAFWRAEERAMSTAQYPYVCVYADGWLEYKEPDSPPAWLRDEALAAEATGLAELGQRLSDYPRF